MIIILSSKRAVIKHRTSWAILQKLSISCYQNILNPSFQFFSLYLLFTYVFIIIIIIFWEGGGEITSSYASDGWLID